MARVRINEKDQLPVVIRLTLNGTPVTPNTLRWKLDCLTSGTNDVVAWTPISASSTVNLTIPSSSHAIVSASHHIETKRITVQANYDSSSTQLNAFVEYDVLKNSGYA